MCVYLRITFRHNEEQHMKLMPCKGCGKLLPRIHRCEPRLIYATVQFQDGKSGWFPVFTGPIPSEARVVEFSREFLPDPGNLSFSWEDIQAVIENEQAQEQMSSKS